MTYSNSAILLKGVYVSNHVQLEEAALVLALFLPKVQRAGKDQFGIGFISTYLDFSVEAV